MPITADGIHMLRAAVLRLVEEASQQQPQDDPISDEQIRQIRSLCGALLAAVPMSVPTVGGPPAEPAIPRGFRR